MNKEKIEHHILHLKEKHDELDNRVAKATEMHSPQFIINTLKKEKLALKDEIEKFKKQIV